MTPLKILRTRRHDGELALQKLRVPLMVGGSLVIVAHRRIPLLRRRALRIHRRCVCERGTRRHQHQRARARHRAARARQPAREARRRAVPARRSAVPARGERSAREARATRSCRSNALKATYRQKQSELRSAEDTLAYEQRESERQKRLLASGISSQAQVDRAAHARDAAAQAVAAAQQEIASVVANLGGDPVHRSDASIPSVEQAQAELDRAQLDLSYTTIAAPDDGVVTQVEKLQVGDYVNAASPLFALVATHDLWVEANFKEVQLAKMRAGQPATVEIDTYGDQHLQGARREPEPRHRRAVLACCPRRTPRATG